jgi:hypothetical protein
MSATLAIDILAHDRASKEFSKVSQSVRATGEATEKTSGKLGGFGKAAIAAGATAGLALLKFGKDSVHAFADAERQQALLDAALKKFPKTTDTTRASYDSLNLAVMKKTGLDDDALAAGEATLAQFNLTGKQIQAMTPLLADYAVKTGKDLPEAATDLGKAMMGNQKVLKSLGIALPSASAATAALAAAQKDAKVAEEKLAEARKSGDPSKIAAATKDYAEKQAALRDATDANAKASDTYGNVMDALQAKVGGVGEAMGKTATGKAAILREEFGNLQEKVGSKLVPVLLTLADKGMKVVDFIDRNSQVIGPLVAIVGTLVVGIKAWTIAQGFLNTVMTANPIGLVVVAVAGLAAGLIYAYKHSETFRDIVKGTFSAISGACTAMWDVIRPVLKIWVDTWLFVVGALVHGAASAFGWVPGIGGKLKAAAKGFDTFARDANDFLGGVHKDIKVTVKAEVVPTYKGAAFSGKTMVSAFAEGGRPPVGKPSIVGEHGPELFVPDTAGVIIPNGGARAAAVATGPGQDIVVESHLYLDSREIHTGLLRRRRETGVALGLG